MALPVYTPASLGDALSAAVATNTPFFIHGSPGIGKSDIVHAVAASMSAPVIDIRLSQFDSIDLRGIPTPVYAENGRPSTSWAAPDGVIPFSTTTNPEFLEAVDSGRPIILFLDELLQASMAVQAVAFQLVLNRAVGEHQLLPNVRIIAAANRSNDRAGSQKLATPLANRFTHGELKASLPDWKAWWAAQHPAPTPPKGKTDTVAYAAALRERSMEALLPAFLEFRPDLLDGFDPAKGDLAFPTPRAWATVGKFVNLPPQLRLQMVAGTVGAGAAGEFEAFVRVWQAMPDIEDVLQHPKTCKLPDRSALSTMYALCGALAYRSNRQTFAALVDVAERLPDEFAALLLKDGALRCPAVQSTAAFAKAASNLAHLWA